MAYSGTPIICYLLSFGDLVVNTVHLLLTCNIKRYNQGIIPLFKLKYIGLTERDGIDSRFLTERLNQLYAIVILNTQTHTHTYIYIYIYIKESIKNIVPEDQQQQ